MSMMTSMIPPAPAYVRAHGELLTQLGATKVEATDNFTIKLTYTSNVAAVNAEALLKDTIWGAKLVIDNQSTTTDAPHANVYGMADLLKGVAGLDVDTRVERSPDGRRDVFASSADQQLVDAVSALVEPNPAEHTTISVFLKPAATPAG